MPLRGGRQGGAVRQVVVGGAGQFEGSHVGALRQLVRALVHRPVPGEVEVIGGRRGHRGAGSRGHRRALPSTARRDREWDEVREQRGGHSLGAQSPQGPVPPPWPEGGRLGAGPRAPTWPPLITSPSRDAVGTGGGVGGPGGWVRIAAMSCCIPAAPLLRWCWGAAGRGWGLQRWMWRRLRSATVRKHSAPMARSMRRSVTRFPPARIAPRTATPTASPIWRKVLRTPEAMPEY